MLKVNLISFYNRFKEYPTKYSLGTLKLASYIGKNDNIDIKIFPINLDCMDIEQEINKLISNKPDIVGIPNYMWTEKVAQEISKYLNQKCPYILKIIGGPSTNEVNFDKWQGDEIFTLGEGEEILKEICEEKIKFPNFTSKDIKQLHGTNVFSKDYDVNKDKFTQITTRMIPEGIPLYSEKMQKMKMDNEGETFAWYETARGCLYNCGYCGHKTRNNLGKVDLDMVKQEIQNMKKCGIDRVFIVDPIIGGTKENGKKILKIFQEQLPEARLIAYLRPELLDDEYISILKNSNIEEIRLGIQTLNPDVPSWVRSNSIDKIKTELVKLSDTNINWRAELIVGLPGDTIKGLRNSIHYVINEFQPTVLSAYHLTAIPGTKLYKLVDNPDKEWLKVDDNSQVKESHSFNNEEFKQMAKYAVSITSLYNLLKRLQPNKKFEYDKVINFVEKQTDRESENEFEQFNLDYADMFWAKKIYEELKNEKVSNCKTWGINRECEKDYTR